jgi:hypothetical protein
MFGHVLRCARSADLKPSRSASAAPERPPRPGSRTVHEALDYESITPVTPRIVDRGAAILTFGSGIQYPGARTWRAEVQEALGVLADHDRRRAKFRTPSGIYGFESCRSGSGYEACGDIRPIT